MFFMSEVPLYGVLAWTGVAFSARWTTDLSSKVKLPEAINLKASCGADAVTLPAKIGGNETLLFHRVVGSSPRVRV